MANETFPNINNTVKKKNVLDVWFIHISKIVHQKQFKGIQSSKLGKCRQGVPFLSKMLYKSPEVVNRSKSVSIYQSINR